MTSKAPEAAARHLHRIHGLLARLQDNLATDNADSGTLAEVERKLAKLTVWVEQTPERPVELDSRPVWNSDERAATDRLLESVDPQGEAHPAVFRGR